MIDNNKIKKSKEAPKTTGDYKPEYNIGDDNFSFINGTLIIETKNIWNSNISINITKI